jgi:hypothetical protein
LDVGLNMFVTLCGEFKMRKYLYAAVLSVSVLFIFAFQMESFAEHTESFTAIQGNNADTVRLFNGNSIANLEFVLMNNKVPVKYKIENKEIFFEGNQVGYFRTKESYSNYKLHAEWKWPEKTEKGNSGILIHTQKPDSVWPACLQVQLKNGSAGDFIAMNDVSVKETMGKLKETAAKFIASSEFPAGVWNSCDVICIKDSIQVFVNGILQNKGTECNFTKGTIGFQLEGKPIAFRNLFLIKQK